MNTLNTVMDAALTADPFPRPNPQTKKGWHDYCVQEINPPQRLSIAAYQKLDDANRAEYDSSRIRYITSLHTIHTPILDATFELFEQKFLAAHTSRTPTPATGVFLSGPPDCGKTTILMAWLRRMELRLRNKQGLLIPEAGQPLPRFDDGAEYLPCAYFTAHATLKGFLGHGLNFYDTFNYKNSDVNQLQQSLSLHIEKCRTHIVAIDQLQTVAHINAGSRRVSEAIKALMDSQPNLFIIGAGIQIDKLNILSDGHGALGTELGQTASRFILQPIEPFTFDTEESTRQFLQLLTTIEEHFPLLKKQQDDITNQAELIMDLTRGRMGQIMRTLRAAAQTAIQNGTERITQQILENTRRSAALEATT